MRKRSLPVLLIGMVILKSAFLAQEKAEPHALDIRITRDDRLKVFAKTWEAVKGNFFDTQFNGVKWEQIKLKYRPLSESAADKIQLRDVLQKMLGELHASHMNVSMGFGFGTGLGLRKIEAWSVIKWVEPGSPAQIAGVQKGWIVTAWKGDCTKGDPLNAIGFRDLQKVETSVDVACLPYPSMPLPTERDSRMLGNRVAYIHFSIFRDNVEKWFAEQVRNYRSAETMVIDMRRNGGGGINETIKCLDLFFTEPMVVGKFKYRNGKESPVRVTGAGENAYRGRVFVLSDETTGSAAELFAAAMKETGRGVLIGRKTEGELLLGVSHALPNGFKVTVAEADYHTAKGLRIEGAGVAPDESVKLTFKDFQENRDPDLDRVQELIAANRQSVR